MNRIAIATVSTAGIVWVVAAPATAIPVEPDPGPRTVAVSSVPASQQRNLTDVPHRMPYLLPAGGSVDYLP